MQTALDVLLLFVALYPVVTAALWIAGGLIFRLSEERRVEVVTDEDCPGVTVLIPAYNEEAVIATSVRAALASDYPRLELLVLDDGSKDETAAAATAAAGGLIFRLSEERRVEVVTDEDCPGVTVLIPAYNEEAVIATSVRAALDSDYPRLELLVLDDGSTDETATAATAAAGGDGRCRVVRDPVNRGKAERLNAGFAAAAHELVVVTDADAHLHPQAIRRLVERMRSSPLLAAVAGGPFVTNRTRLVCAMQVLEAAAIIGLIRRTQSLTGRVGTVAGVLGIFHRERVVAVGGYDGRVATEDIDLTWRLLLAGWHTAYEPRAVVGMEVPSSVSALWAQRKRWARGQGEVLREHLPEVFRWRNHRMWLISLESLASLIWVVALFCSLVLAVVNVFYGESLGSFAFGLAWGIAISVVAIIQLIVALALRLHYDRWGVRSMLVGALYPVLYWVLSASAALREQVLALIRGPRERHVVWDIPRERLDAG